jgi:hypothetical protein
LCYLIVFFSVFIVSFVVFSVLYSDV